MQYLTITNNEAIEGASSKYSLIQTGALIEYIKENTGYEVINYKEANFRKPEKLGKVKHLFTMGYLGGSNSISRDHDLPTITCLNSYDKSTRLKIFFGFLRGACLNGLIAGDSIASFNNMHYKLDYDKLGQYLSSLKDKIGTGKAMIDNMKAKTVKLEVVNGIAQEAIAISSKTVSEKLLLLDDFQREKALTYFSSRAIRHDDKGETAWLYLNRIQENLIRGFSPLGIRKLNDVNKQVKVNRFLWDSFSNLN